MLNLGSKVLRIYKNTNILQILFDIVLMCFVFLFFGGVFVCRVRGENLQRHLSISSGATGAEFYILCLELHIWKVTVTRMVACLCLPLLSCFLPCSSMHLISSFFFSSDLKEQVT